MPFYLLEIRYNFRTGAREKARRGLKGSHKSTTMKSQEPKPRGRAWAGGSDQKGAVFVNGRTVVLCKSTPDGVFIPCPVCRSGKIMRLYPETAAACVSLFCRKCKRESVVDIQPGEKFDRVTLRKVGA